MRGMKKILGGMLILVSAAQGVALASRGVPVGNWYGEGQPDSRNVMWLSHEWPDGRYEIRFRRCERGKTVWEQTETGRWHYTKGVEEIQTTFVNGRRAYLKDSYRTVSYDGRKHVYRHVADGFVYSTVRVDDNFRLPSCAMVS